MLLIVVRGRKCIKYQLFAKTTHSSPLLLHITNYSKQYKTQSLKNSSKVNNPIQLNVMLRAQEFLSALISNSELTTGLGTGYPVVGTGLPGFGYG